MSEDERPRRKLLGGSGLLLFVCLFLPTLDVCGDTVRPIEFPPAYGAYVGGLAIAAIAFARTWRGRRKGFTALAFVYYGTLVGALATLTDEVVFAIIIGGSGLGTSFHLMRLFSEIEWRDRSISAACMTHALIVTIWTFVIASDEGALYGAYVAVGAATLMLGAAVSAVVADVRAERASQEPVPTARVV